MALVEKLNDCEQLFLELAYDPSRLDEALNLSAELCNGHAAQLYTFDGQSNLLSSKHVGFNSDVAKREFDYLDINPRIKAAQTSKPGEVLFDYTNLTDDDIKADATYQDLIKPNNIDWFAGTKLIQNPNHTILFGVFRGEQAGHFNQEELSQFKWLADRVAISAATALRIDKIKGNQNSLFLNYPQAQWRQFL